MIPATTQRLNSHSPSRVNEAIVERTRESVARYAGATSTQIEARLEALDYEWDVERVKAAAAGVVLLFGVMLGLMFGDGWLAIPAVVGACLVLHAVIGWTPALALVRRMGYRTAQEIAHERYALKAMRGDFHPVSLIPTAQDREDLSRFEGEGGLTVDDAEEPDASDPHIVNEVLRVTKG